MYNIIFDDFPDDIQKAINLETCGQFKTNKEISGGVSNYGNNVVIDWTMVIVTACLISICFLIAYFFPNLYF